MNRPPYRFSCVIAAFIFVFCGAATAEQLKREIVAASIQSSFADIREEIENAVIEQGIVVDYNAKVGEMLNRTAADVGVSEDVYTHAETWQFCSASLSHALVAANPLNIAYCPYTIFAFETKANPGVVTVGFRRSLTRDTQHSIKELESVDALLDEIIKGVAQ